MLKVSRILKAEADYHMEHTAPGKDSCPLYDLTMNEIYPEDVYGAHGMQYYGEDPVMDADNFSVIRAAHGKPNFRVKIYRAIPANLTAADKIKKYEADRKYIQKRGAVPPDAVPERLWFRADYKKKSSMYYEWLCDEIEKLSKETTTEAPITINPGDWVTINRKYAVQHGYHFDEGAKILTKTVSAKDIYTNGDSLNEWGYNPS